MLVVLDKYSCFLFSCPAACAAISHLEKCPHSRMSGNTGPPLPEKSAFDHWRLHAVTDVTLDLAKSLHVE